MTFHSRVMNLEPDYSNPESHAVVYKRGFRDARHAAAEIANEADALTARLAEAEALLRQMQETGEFHPMSVALFLRATDSAPAVHYPVEFGPSDARQLHCACGNPDPAHADSADDALREAVIAAYKQGALDVHRNYQPDRDPDFTEAAHDYAAATVSPVRCPDCTDPDCEKGCAYADDDE